MNNTNIIYSRSQQKIDTEANWLKAVNFTPLKGEIIIYSRDENYSYDRIKLGDGVTKVNNLPFISCSCFPIHGKPTFLTKGQVGDIAIDISSDTYDLYKCVKVNGFGESLGKYTIQNGLKSLEGFTINSVVKDFYPSQQTNIVLYNGKYSVRYFFYTISDSEDGFYYIDDMNFPDGAIIEIFPYDYDYEYNTDIHPYVWKPVVDTTYLKHSIEAVSYVAENAYSIAKGANQALSFNNYLDMINVFLDKHDPNYDENSYNIGQNVLIVTLDVPDLWISGRSSTHQNYDYVSDEDFVAQLTSNGYVKVGYYTFSALETQKVNIHELEKLENRVEVIQEDFGNKFTYPTTEAVKTYVDNSSVLKVDKVEGKDLSTNDFTNEHKTKLDDTPNFYIQPNEPVNAPIGSIWIDTDTTGDVQYIEEVGF